MPLIEESAVRVILLDIEGTTTPVDFVHRTLFGYARENLSAFLHRSSNAPEVCTWIDGLKVQHAFTHTGEYDVQATVTGLGGTANRKASRISVTGDVSTRFDKEAKQRPLPLN